MSSEITFHNRNHSESGYNDLCLAIRNGNTNLACCLINQGVEVNPQYEQCLSHTPLHLAVISRYPEITKLLLINGADSRAKDWNSDSPITLAAKMENRSLLHILLSHNVHNHENLEKFSHLHVACMMNEIRVVKQLVKEGYGKNINKAVSNNAMFWPGYTPLHFAVRYGCNETVEFLLTAGVDMMVEDSRKLTPLHLAHLQQNETVIDQLLQAHKYEFKYPISKQNVSHFHIACTRNDASIVEHFLELDVDLDECIDDQVDTPWRLLSPIHLALYHDCPRVMECLLKVGAQLDCDDSKQLLKSAFLEKNNSSYSLIITKRPLVCERHLFLGKMHIHSAFARSNASKIHNSLYRLVAESPSSDLNAPASMGVTALHLAVRYNCKKSVQFLLNQGADILLQDFKGETPLHVAFRYGFNNIFNLILKNFNSKIHNPSDDDGLSVFHLLSTSSKLDFVENFLKAGVDIDAQVRSQSLCWAGFTALHFACLFRQKELVKLLLQYNANISVRNRASQSPLELVVRNSELKPSFDSHTVFSPLMMKMSHDDYCSLNIQGMSYLHALCINQMTNLSLMQQYLLSHKNEVDEVTKLPELRRYNQCTPLHLAVLFRNFAQAKLLLENEANPFIINGENITPLKCLIIHKRTLLDNFLTSDEFSFILEKFTQSLKSDLFHDACVLCLPNVVMSILDKIPDRESRKDLTNRRDNYRRTPLHCVSRQPKSALKTKTVRLLLTNGASTQKRDFQLDTPLHATCFSEDLDVISLLLHDGSDVNAQNVYGDTPLHTLFLSIIVTEPLVIALLLNNGYDINLENSSGFTCFDILVRDFHTTEDDGTRDDGLVNCIITYLKHMKKLQLIGLRRNIGLKYSEHFLQKPQKLLMLIIIELKSNHLSGSVGIISYGQ
ncbi:hypothetical protein QAD02_004371 [Eretmocerus hayati]|uniref:Uncharacterized protein n=1 Tax=Eretmocerus hayati TaxID=131215 RepID=A0ACC2NU70_9HYME|nr:hypothetical protein QAD02_004371 [Eretmocerus hayati]